VVLALGGITLAGPAGAAAPPAADNPRPKPPRAVSEVQRATIPALRRPAAKTIPPAVREFAHARTNGGDFAPNSSLAREVTIPSLPGSNAPTKWYVMPARGGVCIFGGRAGSCVPNALAQHGALYLQFITPVGADAIPPAGQPVPSTIVGASPEGASSVVAKQQDGQQVEGKIMKGVFVLVATDEVTELNFTNRVPMPRLPGR